MTHWIARTTAALALAAATLPFAHADQAVTQSLVPAQSEITFVARQLGVPLDGRFKRFSAKVAFDPRALPTSKIAFEVDLGSAAVNADTDAELVKPEWFNTAKFPKATFQSGAIKALGNGRFEVAGKLSIKGNARDLVVPVQLTQTPAPGGKGLPALSTATGSFAIKRLDFKVGDGDWADTSVVANDVQVKFKLVLQGVPAL